MKQFDLQSVLHGVAKISLPGGMVGKVCKVLIVVAIAMAAIAWTVKLVWVSVLALLLLFALCFPMLWRLISFADRNPQAAILEGAEFLVHEQLRLGTKARPQLSVNPKEFIEASPLEMTEQEEEEAEQPDTTPPAQLQPGNPPEKEGTSHG